MAETQESNKKPIYKKWWFWLIVIIVIVALASSGSTSENNSKTTLTSSNADSSSDTQVQDNTLETSINKKYSVGEIYEDKSVAIKFVSLDDNFKGYHQYASINNGNKIIKAEFEFENLGSTDFLASAYNFNCYADGYDCEAFWSVDNSGFSSTLSSGKKAKGSVYFQIPINANSVSLEYELNVWTSQKVEFIVK